MISTNIREARIKAGLSQEELAQRLHVVRQTVSKWERDLSVPDAALLVELAQVLQVPVSQLLGGQEDPEDPAGLATRLAEVNAQLAAMQKEQDKRQKISRKRELILFLAFQSLIIALCIHDEFLSALGMSACGLAGIWILYRNLPLMTGVQEADQLGPMRQTVAFSIVLLVLITLGVILVRTGRISLNKDQEEILAWLLIVVLMVFCGWISPRLAWNRHVGLRLPWTIQDPETWQLAHRILGWISLPAAVFYTAAALAFPDFAAVTIFAVLGWIAIRGLWSLLFWWKKYRRR